MRAGLLTIEQGRVVVDLLGVVDDSLAALLWERLAARLEADRAEGTVRPPARLRELLRRWLIAADQEGWAARRKAASKADAEPPMHPAQEPTRRQIAPGVWALAA